MEKMMEHEMVTGATQVLTEITAHVAFHAFMHFFTGYFKQTSSRFSHF